MPENVFVYSLSFAVVILSSSGAFYMICAGQAMIAKYTGRQHEKVRA